MADKVFTGAKGEDLQVFLTRLSIQAEIRKWTPQQHLENLLLSLDGDAMLFVFAQGKEKRASVDSLTEVLAGKYGQLLSVEEALREVDRLEKARMETVSEATEALEKVHKRCPEIGEVYMVNALVKVVPDRRIKEFLLDMAPRTFQEAKEMAERKYRTIAQLNPDDTDRESRLDEKMVNERAREGHRDKDESAIDELARGIERLVLLAEEDRKSRRQENEQRYVSWRGTRPTGEGPEQWGCRKCGGDHFVRECPKAVCGACRETGHTTRFCPKKPGQEGSGNGRERH